MSVKIIDAKLFEEEVLKSEVPVLVDFYADWCGPCKMMIPILEEVSLEINGKAKIVKVNIDENKELAIKYDVMTIPNLIVFKDGGVVSSVAGMQPKPKILQMLGL